MGWKLFVCFDDRICGICGGCLWSIGDRFLGMDLIGGLVWDRRLDWLICDWSLRRKVLLMMLCG